MGETGYDYSIFVCKAGNEPEAYCHTHSRMKLLDIVWSKVSDPDVSVFVFAKDTATERQHTELFLSYTGNHYRLLRKGIFHVRKDVGILLADIGFNKDDADNSIIYVVSYDSRHPGIHKHQFLNSYRGPEPWRNTDEYWQQNYLTQSRAGTRKPKTKMQISGYVDPEFEQACINMQPTDTVQSMLENER